MRNGYHSSRKPRLLYYLGRGGCEFWRSRMPLEQMQKQGLAEGKIVEKAWLSMSHIKKEDIAWADVILQQSVIGSKPVVIAMKYKESGKKVAIDFDDYPWECDVFNWHYCHLGQEEVEIEDPKTGQKSKLWEHGKEGFNLISNRIQKKSWNDLMKICDIITCTTPYLQKKIIESVLYEEQGALDLPFHPERVVPIPNAINFNLWKPYPNSRDKWGEGFRIGYACGASHMVDWLYINDVIFKFLDKHKDAKFVVMGDIGFDLKKRYPNEQLEEWHWADLYDGSYQFMLSTIGLDVGIAPLADKEFNRCKSNIKYQEYSACGYPSILQDMTPYKEDIVNGENALLAGTKEEWFNALEKLYNDKNLRIKLRMNAMATCKALYNVETVAREWADAYSNLLDKKPALELVS